MRLFHMLKLQENALIQALLEVAPREELKALFSEATYSPEDNKVRFYTDSDDRFDAEIWAVLKNKCKFIYAPKQELFLAYHTIQLEDLAMYLCGDIAPEEMSLQERAEFRAARFSTYYHNRVAEMTFRDSNINSIVANSSQPILEGHHSQAKTERQESKLEMQQFYRNDQARKADYWAYKTDSIVRHAISKSSIKTTTGRIKRLYKEIRTMMGTSNSLLKTGVAYDAVITAKLDDSEDGKLAVDNAVKAFLLCFSSYCYSNYSGAEFSQDEKFEIAKDMHLKTCKYDFYDRAIAHNLNRINYENSTLSPVDLFDSEKLTPAMVKKFLTLQGAETSPKLIKVKVQGKDSSGAKIISVNQSYGRLPFVAGGGGEVAYSAVKWCELMQQAGYSVPVPAPTRKLDPIINVDVETMSIFTSNPSYGEDKFMTYNVVKMTKAEYGKSYAKRIVAGGGDRLGTRIRTTVDPYSKEVYYSRPAVAVFLTDMKETKI